MAVHQLPRALRISALGLFLTFAAAACGTDDPLISGDNSPTATGEQSAIGMAAAAACSADLNSLNIAIEAYHAIFGDRPTSESQLIEGGLLNKESGLYDVNAEGDVVNAAGSECAPVATVVTTAAPAIQTVPTPTLVSAEECMEDVTRLEVAVYAHVQAGGSLPVTEKELVEEKFLMAESWMHELNDEGKAVPSLDRPCG